MEHGTVFVAKPVEKQGCVVREAWPVALPTILSAEVYQDSDNRRAISGQMASRQQPGATRIDL